MCTGKYCHGKWLPAAHQGGDVGVQLNQEGLPTSGRRHGPGTDNSCQAA